MNDEAVLWLLTVDQSNEYACSFLSYLGFIKFDLIYTYLDPPCVQFFDGWVIFAEYARPGPPPSPPQTFET